MDAPTPQPARSRNRFAGSPGVSPVDERPRADPGFSRSAEPGWVGKSASLCRGRWQAKVRTIVATVRAHRTRCSNGCMDIYASVGREDALRPLHVLRYPGGKKWLSPHISFLTFVFGRYINLTYMDGTRDRIHLNPHFLIEPFTGGGVVGLSLLNNNLIKRLVLVEKDKRVAAFWRAALFDSRFAGRVEEFRCTRKNVEEI
jgi:hypothetical protein